MEITDQHRLLLKNIQKAMGAWKKLTIGIDGVDGSGKSSIARFLAWQIGMPALEMDLFIDRTKEKFSYRTEDLLRLIDARHLLDRPVIVEGIFLLKVLNQIGIKPEILVYVEKVGHKGSITWQSHFNIYENEFEPKSKAHFLFSWGDT